MTNNLTTRDGLPEPLRVLLAQYPRDIWQSHRNFDGLTRFWLERHLMFRQVLARLQADTRAFIDRGADPDRFTPETARMMGFFLNQLDGHHKIEDMHYFPQLMGLEERLVPGFDLLDSDHHALDGELHEMATDTNTMLGHLRAREAVPGRDAAGRLETRLTRFAGFLDRHLIDEEELVVPVILHHAPRF